MSVVLITGAGRGIGAATAHAAAHAGYDVAVTDINGDAARTVAEELPKNVRAIGVEHDVRDEDAWATVFQDVERQLGPVDILVNNAGMIHTGWARDLTGDQHRQMVDVNFLGPMYGTLEAMRYMKNRGGHIMTVCSMTSFLPLPGYSSYGATKHALRAFINTVAIEERASRVAFTLVHPPGVRTEMLEQEKRDPSAVAAFAEKSVGPEVIAETIVRSFKKRPLFGRPAEIVFPAFGGRFQRWVGAQAVLMRLAMPFVLASGRRALRKG